MGITPPTGNPTSRVNFTTAPTLVNGILGGWSANLSRINVGTPTTPQFIQMMDFTTIESGSVRALPAANYITNLTAILPTTGGTIGTGPSLGPTAT